MGGTLLLADDSITIQKVVELTFAETDHNVVALGSGRELLRRLPEVRPDIVLCDVVMPDLNGYDVCQTLKSDPATLHIPVVLLTGTFEPFDRDRALAVGCDAIVTKPFEARELINTVEDLLRRSEAVRASAASDEGLGMQEIGIPEGVPSLDFTTTGFEKMVPAPPLPELPPEHGIELTNSSISRAFPLPPPIAPPELSEQPPEALSDAFAFADAEIPELPATPFAGTAQVGEQAAEPPSAAKADEPAREIADETFPSAPPFAEETEAVEEVAPPFLAEVPPAAEGAPAREEAAASVAAAAEELRHPEPAAAEVFAAVAPQAEPVPAEVAPEAARELLAPVVAVAPPAEPYQLTDADVDRIAKRAMELMPLAAVAAPAEPAAAQPVPAPSEITDEQARAIATRVLEMARPMLEQVAWEVIPDMAEMLVRARIAELEAAAEQETN